ncbi:MAG: mtDNA inheritance, partitioning of the mitochondrial organelle [Icmadophila ericetorum]|nr:mtDNA inheritance, partitioning of the mitochondrial organelle [Icmadophila ericetorum]
MHEILTLQLGQRASYLATHFWNTQESYHTFPPAPPSSIDHDIHFRAGIGADGSETYLPRTVIYDLKGGFGTLKRVNELYDFEMGGGGGGGGGEGKVWSGKQTVQTQPPIEPSPYHVALSAGITPIPRLTTSSVRYWSDFAHTYFHPRSIVQLNDYALNSSLMPFEKYESGDDLFDSLDKEHDLLDRDLRLWAEECDQMQGMQIFMGADDAWGGFAARYVERIRDEYGKVGLWVWGLEGGSPDQNNTYQHRLLRTTNAARSLHDISSQASMYIPLSMPPQTLPNYISLDNTSQWHSSALLATALESVTLPSRTRVSGHTRTTLNDLEAALNINANQRIARLQCSVLSVSALEDEQETLLKAGQLDSRVPGSAVKHSQMAEDGFDNEDNATPEDLDIDFFASSTPSRQKRSGRDTKPPHIFGQIDSYRGSFPAPTPTSPSDLSHARKRRRIANLPMLETYHTSLLSPQLPTFPPIFTRLVPEGLPDGESVAVHARLSTTTGVTERIRELRDVVVRRMGSVGVEGREELGNGLGCLAEEFVEGWSGGSDSGEDD